MFKRINSRFISVILLCIVTVSLLSPAAAAVYYEGSFPYTETGLTGGYYIECPSSIGDIVIIIPEQYGNNVLTFTTSGNLFNTSASTVSVALFLNGTQYSARFPAFGTLEYRISSSGYYDYTAVTTSAPTDTNVVFCTASYAINDNYYFSKFEMAVIALLLMILFFVFLGWFLLHRIR